MPAPKKSTTITPLNSKSVSKGKPKKNTIITDEPMVDNLNVVAPAESLDAIDYVPKDSAEAKEEVKKVGKKKVSKAHKLYQAPDSFSKGFFRTAKSNNPEISYSKDSMALMNDILISVFESLCKEASGICDYANKQTLTAREVEFAVKKVFPPGELKKHALVEMARVLQEHKHDMSSE